jgi:hypothetical protein
MLTNEPIAGAIIKDSPPAWAGSPLDWPDTLGRWVNDLPAHAVRLWHLAGALWWPWAPLFVLALVLGTIAVRLVLRTGWRRVAAGGYWVAITPPRVVDAGRWALVWRRLDGLARSARGGRWRLVKPPLAFEVWTDGPGLRAGLWLPGWVPLTDVAGDVARAWPGATVTRTEPPTLDGGGAVAGLRLAADTFHPETGWLVDDPRPRTGARRGTGSDPELGTVFSALADPDTQHAGRLLLQVLVRPAPRGRLTRLAAAARNRVDPRRGGVQVGGDALLWLLQAVFRAALSVLEVFLSSGSSSSRSRSNPAGREAPDPIEREAMAEARAKHNDRPHVLAVVRVGAAGGRRREARRAAGSVADGYGEASRWLRPVRLRRPAVVLSLRRAGRGEWLLLSASELGVLAHLPPDPALYRFDTAALHRPFPGGARRADPEPPTGRGPGWTRRGWTAPPDTGAVNDDGDPDENQSDDNDSDDYGDDEYPEAV